MLFKLFWITLKFQSIDLAETFLWIFSEIQFEFVRILAAFSERRQSNSKKSQ